MQTNRRNFLKLGSTVALTSVASSAMAVPTSEPQKWDQEYDIVIVGAGGAGLAAAVESVKKGLKAIVVEKEPIIGGSSTLCGGKFAVSETEAQKARGIKDTHKKFFNDMLSVGQNENDPALVKVLISESLNHYNFITKELGIQPKEITAGAGMSEPRGHAFKPAEVLKAMADYAKARGAKIVLGVKAERLIWDDKKKQIIGITCSRKGKSIAMKATKWVVLASGGFSYNRELLKKYVPAMAKADVIAGLGTTGDGLKMAQAYGADVADMSYIKATYGFKPKASTISEMAQVYYGGAVMINKAGKRFINESISYKLLGDAALIQPDGASYLVFDEPIRIRQMKHRSQDRALFSPVDEGKKLDYLFTGNTIEEAAKNAGLPADEVVATVKRYNDSIATTGKDAEFGRSTLTGGYGKPVKIEKAPFYIMPATAVLIATYCGLRINDQAQVIDVFGEPIKHLYAAGEITGGVHGAAYMTGTAWGKAMAFGRIAARSISKN